MSKYVPIILGAAEIAGGILIDIGTLGGGALLGNALIAAGVGTVIGGVGTLLGQPQQGLATASRNPIAPRVVCYGRCKVGGTIVYINESGDSDKYLDLIFVLATHPCESVDAVLFDNQRVLIGANGNSFSPTQQTVNISEIIRSNGVVTVTMSSPFIDIADGDLVQIQNVAGDESLNGKYYIGLVNSTTFTYNCGGLDADVTSSGQVVTTFPDYRGKVHMESLLGNQTATFPGMIDGTPYDDSDSDTVTVDNNPWTSDCLLNGCTAVFLRLHYNDEVFAAGLPQISFRLHGKNDIADPRDSSTGYTENSALCIADYLKNQKWGFRASDDEVPDAKLITAANICDEDVDLAAGSTEKRYTLNGSFPLSMKRGEVLQNMLTSCGGRITYSSGEFVIHPAAWGSVSGGGPSLAIGKSITSGTMSVVTTHIPGTGYAAAAEVTVGDPNSIWDGATIVLDSSAWTSRTDTATLVGPPASLTVSFALDGSLLGDADPADELRVYDCYFDATYADGTTARLRPTRAEAISSSTGTVDNPNNALGGDLDTFATITRHHFSSLGNSPVLRISNFLVGDSGSSTPDTSDTGIADSLPALSQMIGPFRWRQKVSIRDLYNGVKGTYISPTNDWQISDFPPYAQDTLHGYGAGASPANPEGDANMAADGGDRRWYDIQLPFTISSPTAQRLAKIELLRRRQQGTGTFTFNMSPYWGTALDVVTMTLPLLGWTSKLLEVASHRLAVNSVQDGGRTLTVLGCEVDVQETDPSVYEWDVTEELTPQGFQQSGLPSTANPKPPTSVTLTSDDTTSIIGADGIARSRILVQWVAPADGYVLQGGHIEIQYHLTSSPLSPWISAPNVDPTVTQAYIDGVTDGTEYTVQIRSVNAAGVPSVWVDAGSITVSGASSAIDPSIINRDGATTGQGLIWNGSEWAPGTATAIELQTDGTDNGSQSKLNLAAGDDITLTDGGTGTVTIALGDQPFLVLSYLVGKPDASAVVLKLEIPSNLSTVSFPANFSGSVMDCGTNPTASATYDIAQNGTSIGSLVISTSGVATFTTTSGTAKAFSASDVLTITAPSSQDSTLSDVTITLAGTR